MLCFCGSAGEAGVSGGDIGGGVTLGLAVVDTAAGDIAEEVAPAAVVVQIFPEIVVMVVGVEHIDLILLVDAVFVQILPGVHQPGSAPGDPGAVVIGTGGIAGGDGAGGADVHFVVPQVAAAAGNVGKLRFVRVSVGIADEIGVVQPQMPCSTPKKQYQDIYIYSTLYQIQNQIPYFFSSNL